MPQMSQGLPMYLSTAANIGTRVKGPMAAGQISDNGTGGPIPAPGGVMCVQSTASITNQVVTTSAVGLANASFIYIPVTTGPVVGSTALPPYQGVGTPIVWDDANKRLQVWSSGSVSWLATGVNSTSTANSIFTSS